MCVRACMRACVRDVFAIYDNDILPMLIMIIINIIILYFIQIRHTDDLPSTGTGLVLHKSVCMSVCLSVCLSVGARKRHVAILARSSQEMSLTDRTV